MKRTKIKAQPFDCMQYLYSAAQKPLIRAFVRFSGHINENVLKKAVDISMNSFPLIGCCFDDKALCWKIQNFTANDIVHIIESSENDENPAKKLLLSSIDIKHEPQIKIFLIRSASYDTLCVIINHMISDGGGFKQYLYSLANLYSKCAAEKIPTIMLKPYDKRNLNQILHGFSLKEKLDLLFSKTVSPKPDPAMHLPLKGDKCNPFIVIHNIDKEHFEKIKSFAKCRHISINDMLLTAYIRALNKTTGYTSITVPCPVDLRKYKKSNGPCGICNLTGNYFCHINFNKNDSFDTTLKAVSKQMDEQKNSYACLKGPMLYHIMFHTMPFNIVRKLFYKISPVPVTSYTNLGVIDQTKFKFGDLALTEAFISTAVKYAPYFQLSVSTFNGCCTLTSSFHGTEDDRKYITDFLNNIDNELQSIF